MQCVPGRKDSVFYRPWKEKEAEGARISMLSYLLSSPTDIGKSTVNIKYFSLGQGKPTTSFSVHGPENPALQLLGRTSAERLALQGVPGKLTTQSDDRGFASSQWEDKCIGQSL